MRILTKGRAVHRAVRLLRYEVSARDDGAFVVSVPVKTSTETNTRQNWYAVAGNAKREREATCLSLKGLHVEYPALIKSVKLTRHGLRLMDDDNLPGSMKRVRDQVAAWIAGNNTPDGKGDDSPTCGVAWSYDQVKGKEYGVVLELRY